MNPNVVYGLTWAWTGQDMTAAGEAGFVGQALPSVAIPNAAYLRLRHVIPIRQKATQVVRLRRMLSQPACRLAMSMNAKGDSRFARTSCAFLCNHTRNAS
jgi:hypothetical protein